MKLSPAEKTYRNAKREAVIVLAMFAVACLYSVTVCHWLGYHRPLDEIKLVWGMPQWVFYGVILPWIIMLPVTAWFCFRYMAEDDLAATFDDKGSDT